MTSVEIFPCRNKTNIKLHKYKVPSQANHISIWGDKPLMNSSLWKDVTKKMYFILFYFLADQTVWAPRNVGFLIFQVLNTDFLLQQSKEEGTRAVLPSRFTGKGWNCLSKTTKEHVASNPSPRIRCTSTPCTIFCFKSKQTKHKLQSGLLKPWKHIITWRKWKQKF